MMTLPTKQPLVGTPTDYRPLCLHVYRVGAIWGEDKIVRAEDKKTLRYYSKGERLSTNWQFAVRAGGPNGVLVCQVKSPYVGPPIVETDPGPISIILAPESQRQIVKLQRGSGALYGFYSFKGLDDEEYHWQAISRICGNKLECLNSQDQVVATYRVTQFAMSKDGELRIHQPVQFMADLLVATCLAMRTPDH